MAEPEPTTFNITVDDTSPQIVYRPLISTSATPFTDLQNGWLQFFNASGFNSFPGQRGLGESAHVTTKDGATMSIGFTGEQKVSFPFIELGVAVSSLRHRAYALVSVCSGIPIHMVFR